MLRHFLIAGFRALASRFLHVYKRGVAWEPEWSAGHVEADKELARAVNLSKGHNMFGFKFNTDEFKEDTKNLKKNATIAGIAAADVTARTISAIGNTLSKAIEDAKAKVEKDKADKKTPPCA